MSQLDEYLAVILLYKASLGADEAFGGSVHTICQQVTREIHSAVDAGDILRATELLSQFGASDSDYSPLTGGYWHIDFDNFRYYFIEDKPEDEDDLEVYRELSEKTNHYPILQAYARRGSRYAKDVIAHLLRSSATVLDDLREAQSEISGQAPASDRVVSLNHNQSAELVETTDKLIENVTSLNAIPGEAGARESILGQLKAGRELLREGCFRLYVIEVTLINALEFLAKRYEREAIGALASALLTALAIHLGTSH